jgi:imidazolonepropionase-like amidohydrolase
MFVYPAFIDGLSHVGITEPKQENQPAPADRGNPGFERQGVQPERSAAELVDPESKALASLREAGFAIANVVPYGNMLPGSSAITSLGVERPTFLRKDAAMYTQLSGTRGVYPGTPVGVMAYFRQLYREAERQQQWTTAYAANPTNMQHPPGEAVYEAFFPVIDKTRPVLFYANSVLEVQRAARLRNDLGFQLIIAGAKEAAEMIQPLAQYGFPVILSVELPKEDKKAAKSDAQSGAKSDSTKTEITETYNPAFMSSSEAQIDDERKNLQARRAETRQRYLEAAAALEKAGVAFGFSTVDVKPNEVLPNVRKMVEAGLSEAAALAALTANNARILGIERSVGTLQAGKLANIVVTTAPLFEKDTQIKFVFVDGTPTEVEVKEKKDGGDAEAAAEFVGVWRFLVDSPDGPIPGSFDLELSRGSLVGNATALGYSDSEIEDIEVDADEISFAFDNSEFGRISISATRDNDQWNGVMTVPEGGDIPFTARRGPG